MAHRLAPHPLAEAIAELAAPAVAESFLFVLPGVTCQFGYPVLLLHLRPRRLAAGLEAAVRCGNWTEEGGEQSCEMWQSGPVFAVTSTPSASSVQQRATLAADIDSFVAELLDTTWPFSDDLEVELQLPERAADFDDTHWCIWKSVQLLLLPPAALEVSALPGDRMRARMLADGGPTVLSEACVKGRSIPYARLQAPAREEQLLRRGLQAAAAGGDGAAAAVAAGLPPPAYEYDEVAVEARYAELRADDMRRLAAAIATQLKLACRFRGMVPAPLGAPPPEE